MISNLYLPYGKSNDYYRFSFRKTTTYPAHTWLCGVILCNEDHTPSPPLSSRKYDVRGKGIWFDGNPREAGKLCYSLFHSFFSHKCASFPTQQCMPTFPIKVKPELSLTPGTGQSRRTAGNQREKLGGWWWYLDPVPFSLVALSCSKSAHCSYWLWSKPPTAFHSTSFVWHFIPFNLAKLDCQPASLATHFKLNLLHHFNWVKCQKLFRR